MTSYSIRFSIFIILLLSSLLWLGCGEDETPAAPTLNLEIEWYIRPPNLEATSLTYVPICATVSGINPYSIDSVKAIIRDDAGNSISECGLYDDAGFYQHDDALDFCSPYSGDVVARNGIFSRMMNGQFAPETGTFTFNLYVWAGDRSAVSPDSAILVALSTPPEFISFFFPDTLHSGNQVEIHVDVIDLDVEIDDSVTVVYMKFYSPDEVELDSLALSNLGGDQYGTTLQPEIAVGLPSDDYIFAFRALDTFNNLSDSLGVKTYLENLAPVLNEPSFSDSVELLIPGFIEVPIMLEVNDGQTIADIDSVNMLSQKPDLSYANNGSPIPLYDDGQFGDEIPGDGIYSLNAILYDTSQVGTYIFTFWARDLVGNASDEVIDTMIVVSP